MQLMLRLASVAIALIVSFQGCDLNDPLKGTPFGRRAPAAGQPQLAETYPEFSLTDVDPNGPFRLKFDRAMEPSSVTSGVSLQPAIPLTVRQGADASEWIVTPGNRLEADREYTMQVSSGVRSQGGTELGRTVDIRFRTRFRSQTLAGQPAWTPDGAFVFFSASFDGGKNWYLWRVPRGGGWKQRVSDNVLPYGEVSISPDGRRVAFPRQAGGGSSAELAIVNADGASVRTFVAAEELGGPVGVRGVWAPGSDRLALELDYGRGGSGQDDITAIALVALDGAILRRVASEGMTYRLMGWSSDGRDLIVMRSQGTAETAYRFRYEIVNWATATGALSPVDINATLVNVDSAIQSRDYSTVAFWTWRPVKTGRGTIRVPSELWVYRIGSNTVSRVAPTSAGNRDASFSPDGSQLVFNSNRTGEWLVWAVGRNGAGVRQVTSGTGADLLPAWSPDGAEVGFVSTRNGEEALWAIGANGNNPRRLAGRW